MTFINAYFHNPEKMCIHFKQTIDKACVTHLGIENNRVHVHATQK